MRRTNVGGKFCANACKLQDDDATHSLVKRPKIHWKGG